MMGWSTTSASIPRRNFHSWRRQLRNPPQTPESTESRAIVGRESASVQVLWRSSRMTNWLLIGAATAALMLGSPADAHIGTGLAGGVESGFAHPFTGVDHLLAMFSVGLWGVFLGRPLIYVLPVMFPAMMVAGAVLGMFHCPLPPMQVGVALSVLMLGLCIALALKAPVWVATPIVAAFAVFHGYAHGVELPSAADPVGYSLGFVVATGFLHVVGIGAGTLNGRPGGLAATRSMGAIIAGLGAWYLCKALVA
jgi:urease accessory protein